MSCDSLPLADYTVEIGVKHSCNTKKLSSLCFTNALICKKKVTVPYRLMQMKDELCRHRVCFHLRDVIGI